MADPVKVTVHEQEIIEIARLESTRRMLQGYASYVVRRARDELPRSDKPHIHGADTVHSEDFLMPAGWEIRIGWDRAHSYMASLHTHKLQEIAEEVAAQANGKR